MLLANPANPDQLIYDPKGKVTSEIEQKTEKQRPTSRYPVSHEEMKKEG
jgi:hypothetical protein